MHEDDQDPITEVFYADTETTSVRMGDVSFSHGPAKATKIPVAEMDLTDAPTFEVEGTDG